MLTSTTFEIDGYHVTANKGIARGLIVWYPSDGVTQALGGFLGWTAESLTHMCEQARDEAYRRMMLHAETLGAQAVIGIRYDNSIFDLGQRKCSEVVCYGTAVTIAR